MRPAAVGTCLLAFACAEEPHVLPECVTFDVEACTPLYPAEFAAVFEETLLPTCSQDNSACHVDADASGAADRGLFFAEPAQSHDVLTMGVDPVVLAGDSACSELFVRISISDREFRMPPGGSALDERAQCSIARWIEAGALP